MSLLTRYYWHHSPQPHWQQLPWRYTLKLGQDCSIFLFLIWNICCGYSKELSQWDDSFENPKQMLKLMDKKKFTILCSYHPSRPMNLPASNVLADKIFLTSLSPASLTWRFTLTQVQDCSFFLSLNQKLCCGYTIEPSKRDGSFETPKQMFKLMDKKILTILKLKIIIFFFSGSAVAQW